MDAITFIINILTCVLFLLFISIPIYYLHALISFKLTIEYEDNKIMPNKNKLEVFYTFVVFSLCLCQLNINKDLINAGKPLERYSVGEWISAYNPLSSNHILTFLVFFILGIIAYLFLKIYLTKLPPIPYVLCCSMLIINIIFMSVYLFHVSILSNFVTFGSLLLGVFMLIPTFLILIIMYILALIESMNRIRQPEETLNKSYKNKYFNKIYIFFIKYNSKPIVWIIALFPILIIIQLILVLFGQQPDSFIKVFFETSNYNLSKVVPPDPIIIEGHSHYLCTVSAHGHKKIVKPLRSGIRRNKRILVNRQLLIANAFENILEQYTPKFHKAIRYIYDKYGYPLSKHINTKLTADLVYLVMKPLEWVFLIVLYCVEKTLKIESIFSIVSLENLNFLFFIKGFLDL